jgi:hypothetical protein
MNQRGIYYFDCCNDGRPRAGRIRPDGKPIEPHYFLIVSNTGYNKKSSKFITAIPFSSKKNTLSDWAIMKIDFEQLEQERSNPKFSFLGEDSSYVLVDRPCRIAKDEINKKNELVATLKFPRYKEVIEQLATFMKSV